MCGGLIHFQKQTQEERKENGIANKYYCYTSGAHNIKQHISPPGVANIYEYVYTRCFCVIYCFSYDCYNY